MEREHEEQLRAESERTEAVLRRQREKLEVLALSRCPSRSVLISVFAGWSWSWSLVAIF